MSSHIEEALTTARPEDHAAHARAALVLADAYHLAGSYTLARPWYEKARLRSADDGDNATLSAMLYNVAAIRASNVRLNDTFGVESSAEAHRAGMEIASSRHYDHAIDTHGLAFLSLLLRGLLATVSKKFEEALHLFESIDTGKLQYQMLSPFYADMAWCMANTGRVADSNLNMTLAIDNMGHLFEADDKAYVNSRISQILILLKRPEDSKPFGLAATEYLTIHRAFQKGLLGQLEAIRKK